MITCRNSELELRDTSLMMESKDYKERFKGEYFQVSIRLKGLKKMLDNWDKGELPFTPTCPRAMYDAQVKAMEEYKNILIERAKIEDINL